MRGGGGAFAADREPTCGFEVVSVFHTKGGGDELFIHAPIVEKRAYQALPAGLPFGYVSRRSVNKTNLRRTATLFGEVVDVRLEFVEASEGGVAIKCG